VHSMAGGSGMPRYMDIDVGALAGYEIIAAIERGKIWLSLVNLQEHHAALANLVADLYGELEDICDGFQPSKLIANLLVSSPTAEVFYHADAYPGLLWHLSGEKQVIVYPPWEDRYLSAKHRELCLAGQLVDDVYAPEFDQDAQFFDMQPGQFICWPQSTPHRVVNTSGLNLSLATEHDTAPAARRRTVASANWWFRKNLGINCRGTSITGPKAYCKRLAFIALRRGARLIGRQLVVPTDHDISPGYRLNPDDPRGYSEI